MNLTERHMINNNHPFYKECDELCFKSKNIYNLSLYKVKNGLLENDYDVLNRLFHYMKHEDCFKQLPMKVATATIIQVQKNFKAFFKAKKIYNENKSKFLAAPEQPKYLNKIKGRFVISYNYQAISSKQYKKDHSILLSGTNIKLYTKIENFNSINCVRIVPGLDKYIIEICYSIEDVKPITDINRCASIDLGINNLATITSNISELKPIIVNGKPLKSINQFYNKKLSKYKSNLEITNKKKYSKKTRKLTNKRNNKVDDYLHKASKQIVDVLKEKNINKLVIGKNDNWKQNSEMKKSNNQNFISIPHNSFIQKLTYKCEKSGISVIQQEESYTSKASFLNSDFIPIYGENNQEYSFSGKRIKRGLYKTDDGILINADVNGSYNILRKAIPNAFADGIEGVVVHPVIMKVITN